jgi:putative ABC transport system substrate-binding protein
MRRREFITLMGAAVVLWPSVVQAQQQKRRLAVIQGGLLPGDADGQREVAAFERGLNELGWKPGINIDIDYYWPGSEIGPIRDATGDAARTRPDVVISRSTPVTAAIMGTGLPIIFLVVADPVTPGFVQSISKPGHNVTGFTNLESSMSGKWLVLLKEAAPTLKTVGLLFNPATAPFAGTFLRAAAQAAQPLDVSVKPILLSDANDIEAALADLASQPGGGFMAIADIFLNAHRELIVSLAAKYRLPAIYGNPNYAPIGGLMSYSVNYPDLFRRAADYTDRILKGAKPADLPVQLPERYDLVINLKTAKSLGLTFPQTLLAIANEVIE